MVDILRIERTAGWIFLALAVLFLFFPLVDAAIFFYTVAALVSLTSIAFFINFFREKKAVDLIAALISLIIAAVLWTHSAYSRELIVWFFSFYMIFNALVYLVQIVLDLREKSKNTWFHIVLFILYTALSIFSVLYAGKDVRIIMYYFSVYLFLMAFEMLDKTYSIFDIRSSRDFLMRYWVALPVYFTFLIPSLFLRRIDHREKIGENVPLLERKNDQEVNFHVYVHTGLNGEHIAGHMTLSHDDIMYSYGNYDASREKFFRSVGPGILFTVPAKPYVNNSCIYEGSTLFDYGLHLSDEQLEKFESMMKKLHDESYRWQSPIEKDAKGHLDFKKYEKDYASRLFYRTGAKFREFHSGQWKNYWIFGENCSVFGETVLKEIGLDILPKLGIITPGEYFVYMERAYEDPESPVITRAWHDAQFPKSLYNDIA